MLPSKSMLRMMRALGFSLISAIGLAFPAMAFAQEASAPPPLSGPTTSTSLARIASPVAGSRVHGVVPMVGAAAWPGTAKPYIFMSSTLLWGAGSDPSSFTTLDSEQIPNMGGSLGNWDTSGLPDGQYIIRLLVANYTGNYVEVRVPVIVDNSGSYAGPIFTVSAPAAQPKGSEPSAIVTGSSSYTDPLSGQLHVVGEVQNNGNANLQFVQVTATFKDAAGNSLQTASGFTLLPILVPGQKAPFDIFTFPPTGMAGAADLNVTFATTPNPPLGGLALSGDHLAFDSAGKLHLTGYITNSSRDPSTLYRVALTIYDGNNVPVQVGVFTPLAAPGTSSPSVRLSPGTSTAFDFTVPNPPQSFGSYALAVQ